MHSKLSGFFHKFFDATFLRYFAVGVVNTLVGTSIMFGMYNLLHFNYWVSSASNYILSSILSFFLNRYFTFHRRNTDIFYALRFAANIGICYLVAYGLSRPLMQMIFDGLGRGGQENLAMLAGVVIFAILNYGGQRFFVFRYNGDSKKK